MDERAVLVSESDLGSSLLEIPGHDDLWSRKSEGWFPVCFGISYAFFVLRLISSQGSSTGEDEGRSTKVCEKLLGGSIQLLGMLAWKSQKLGFDEQKRLIGRKLEALEMEIEELRKVRREDAKANEKVVGIFAAQEQRWFNERRKLQQHVSSLIREIRVLTKKKDEVVSELNGKIKELEVSVRSMEKSLEEERVSVKDLKEKLRKAKVTAEDLRERAKHEAEDHSAKIWKHKKAFIEVVLNQRRTEAELDRAIRQLEASKQEFESVFVQEESTSVAQKLSMELMRMQTDVEQKDKILSAMLRKSRLDAAEKQMLIKQVKLSKSKMKQSEFDTEMFKALSDTKDAGKLLQNMFANQVNARLQGSSFARKEWSVRSGSSQGKHSRSQSVDLPGYGNRDSMDEIDGYPALYDGYPPEDYKRLNERLPMEVEKYAKAIEQRHQLEVDAFVEQMGMRDKKLEEFRWSLLSMEIESKSLHSHVEALNEEISQLRLDNTKLEATLISREEELESKYRAEAEENKAEIDESPLTIQRLEFRAVQSPDRETDEEEEAVSRSITVLEARETLTDTGKVEKSLFASEVLLKNPPRKMDLQALGAFYKIKRLKQQLLMLERLIGKQESGSHNADGTSERALEAKNFLSLITILNKQVLRYESLQERIDDLCKRVHEKNLDMTHGDSDVSRTKGRTKELEILLEETFQLQRYMVSTGQKMMEIQSKVSNGFIGMAEQVDKSIDIDTKRFCEGLRSLFRDVQGGLEVRITRIIGDLECTLACDGMINLM